MTEWTPGAGPAWLFCPADRPERFAKAAARADVVILDLEDGVAPADRERARSALADVVLDPVRTIVRVSPAGTHDQRRDLLAVARTPYRTVMLAKTESPKQPAGLRGLNVIALCETPPGVLRAEPIAAVENVVALMWGAEDLMAGLGGQSSRHGHGGYRDVARHARSAVLLAAAVHSKAAVDAVYLDIDDLTGLAAESADAMSSGFRHKACIHPTQAPIVQEAFQPAPAEVERARRIVSRAETEPGVFAFEGQMVDEPLLRQARTLIARAASNLSP